MLFQRTHSLYLNNFNNFDVLLKCNDVTFYAHRLVLAAASSMFRQIFESSETDENIITIILSNFDGGHMLNLLNFLYGREENLLKGDILTDLGFDIFSPSWVLPLAKISNTTQFNSQDDEIKNELDDLFAGNGKADDIDFSVEDWIVNNDIDNFINESPDENFEPKKVRKKREVKSEKTTMKQKTKTSKSRDCLKKNRNIVVAGKNFDCDQCNHQSNTKSELRAHKKECHQKEFSCDKCPYVAKNTHNLKVHRLAIHEGHKYMCDQCDYSAKTTISLTEHIKVVHQGIKKLCDQCDYVGTTVWSLRKHKEKHHDKVRVYCDKCQYFTTFKSELNQHIKIVHEGFRYYCNLCDYSSQKKVKVKRHKQSRHEIDYKPNTREDILFKSSL